MKKQRLLKSLIQQLTHWRRWYKTLRRKGLLLEVVINQSDNSHRGGLQKFVLSNILLFLSKTSHESGQPKPGIALRTMTKSVNSQQGLGTIGIGWIHKKRSSVVLAIAVVSLTGVIGHKLYNQPKLKVGTIAPQTITAPYTTSIEDEKQTEIKRHRKVVSQSSRPILMVDTPINEKINRNLQQLLDKSNEIRVTAGAFPFFDTSVLSVSSQSYLRSCTESEWQTLLAGLENTRQQQLGFLVPKRRTRGLQQNSTFSTLNNQPSTFNRQPSTLTTQKVDFSQAVAELENYRITTSQQNLSSLIAQILQARQKYVQAKAKLVQMPAVKLEISYDQNIVLDLSDDDWEKTRTGITQSSERILTQGIPFGLPSNILPDTVRLQVQTFVAKDAEPLAINMLLTVLEPNLTKDEEKTQEQAKQAAAEIAPVMVDFQKGEVIVTKGDKISEWNFEVLEYYHLISREINWRQLLKLAIFVSVAIGIFVFVERRMKTPLRQRDRLLVLLLALSTPGVLTMGVVYTTWSAIGLLLGSFYGGTLGLTVVGLLLVVLSVSVEISKISLLAGASAGIVGSCMAKRLRSREELALLGVAIALTEGGIYLILKVLIGAAFGSAWYLVLQEAALFAVSGLAWSIVALGLSPYLEKLFDLVTPIRLAELSSPNRPLLKRLATEAPGTFQHTLFVSTLAEAAAKQLGCNVELVRAGTLYHDIGKMHDPLGFIENQMGGPNKHDTEIQDPWKSAELIKKHVSEGLTMARKHLLPTAIQAFIPEHQGTMLIAYFHHQAQQMAKDDPSLTVNDADFRYDGPIPQSRETAIVMLADSCEAALRSLKDATPEQALAMLNNILRARWQDNQLVDSGLTRDEMTRIAQIFVEVWQQFHHKRIAYPKSKASNEKVPKG
ncbi:MAG: HD family phosphohydrolase [Gloeotrichia echinulata GP01]